MKKSLRKLSENFIKNISDVPDLKISGINIDSTKGTLVINIAKINCSTIPESTNLQFIFLLSEDNK